MKPNKLWFSMAVASVYAMHFVGANASSVVTSKTYVDAKISSSADISSTSTTTAPNEKAVYDAISSATSATNNLLTQVISNADTSHAPSGDAVYDALADKQNTIDTGLVSLGDEWIEDLPAVVSYDTTSGLVGNKYGILDYNGSVDYVDDGWNNYQEDSETNHLIPTVGAVGRELQNIWDNMPSVPTITWNSNDTTAVNNYSTSFTGTGNWPSAHEDLYVTGSSLAQGLALKQNKIDAINNNILADSDQVGAVLAPTGTAGVLSQIALFNNDGDMGSWPSPSDNTPYATLLRNSIPTVGAFGEMIGIVRNAQTKIPARATKIESTDSTYAPSVVTNGTTDGSVGQMAILTNYRLSVDDGADGGEFSGYTNADSLIPTAAAVGAELEYKQNSLGGTPEYAGKVVTATGTAGTVTYTAIDSTPTSASTNLVTSGGVYTAVNAKQTKKTCAGWLDGTTVADSTHTDANCVLWNLPD